MTDPADVLEGQQPKRARSLVVSPDLAGTPAYDAGYDHGHDDGARDARSAALQWITRRAKGYCEKHGFDPFTGIAHGLAQGEHWRTWRRSDVADLAPPKQPSLFEEAAE